MRDRLADRFEFHARGVVDLKGTGPTQTWFLSGRKRDALPASSRPRAGISP